MKTAKFISQTKEFFKNKYVSFILQCILTAVGTFIMSIAFKCFFVANNITPGGFSGLATIVPDLFSKVGVNLNPSIVYILLNVVLFIVALLSFGYKFTALTIVGAVTYSLFIEYNPIPNFTPNMTGSLTLVAIIGGAISGIGIGLLFRLGASTGGSDIIALSINKKFPKIKTGQCHLIINALVILLSVIVYKNLELALYTIIAIFVSSTMTDKILSGIKTVRAVYIICSKDQEIADKIMEHFHQGVTRIDAEGMYSQQEKKLLLCLVSTHQAPFIKSVVTKIEPNAIVYSTSVNEAVGEKAFLKAKKQGIEIHLNLHKDSKLKLKTSTKYNRTQSGKKFSKYSFNSIKSDK